MSSSWLESRTCTGVQDNTGSLIFEVWNYDVPPTNAKPRAIKQTSERASEWVSEWVSGGKQLLQITNSIFHLGKHEEVVPIHSQLPYRSNCVIGEIHLKDLNKGFHSKVNYRNSKKLISIIICHLYNHTHHHHEWMNEEKININFTVEPLYSIHDTLGTASSVLIKEVVLISGFLYIYSWGHGLCPDWERCPLFFFLRTLHPLPWERVS